jgi:hypothetical protein
MMELDINTSGSIAVNLQQNIISTISPVLSLIVTLLAVYIGHHLALLSDRRKIKETGRKRAYAKFLKLFIKNSRGEAVDAEDLWNCCIEIEKYGSRGTKDPANQISSFISNCWINKSWEDKIDEHQSTNQLVNQLGPDMISKIKTNLTTE